MRNNVTVDLFLFELGEEIPQFEWYSSVHSINKTVIMASDVVDC